MRNEEPLFASLRERLTIEEFACACRVSPAWVVGHVEEGVLAGVRGDAGELLIAGMSLRRARRLRTIERDFEAVPELAGLVADLLDEIDALRARLRGAGLDDGGR